MFWSQPTEPEGLGGVPAETPVAGTQIRPPYLRTTGGCLSVRLHPTHARPLHQVSSRRVVSRADS